MAIQTSFAKEVTWPQDCNHRFLALLGNDGELDLALLDVKNRVRGLSLRKKQLDPSGIWISFFPRQPWQEILWDQTWPCLSSWDVLSPESLRGAQGTTQTGPGEFVRETGRFAMASQSNQSYSFDGYVVECRGSGHEAAPRACSARANSGAYVIVRHTSSSNYRPAFPRTPRDSHRVASTSGGFGRGPALILSSN
jgi:hypothetical protein